MKVRNFLLSFIIFSAPAVVYAETDMLSSSGPVKEPVVVSTPVVSKLPRLHAWVAYFRGPHGETDLSRARKALDEVSVFALQFSPDGALMPASPWVEKILTKLKASAPLSPIWLTVVNDIRRGKTSSLKDPDIIHEKLATPEARTAHINELMPWSQQVDGLDIDYESLRKEDGEAFSLFIEELAQRLHAEGKRLSVTVEPKTDGGTGDGAKALDWQRIGAAVDQVRVMAYFYHSPGGPPGPIAPLDWLARLSQYGKSQIPVDKLSIVLTVNGIDWPMGQRGRPIRFHTVSSLIAYERVKPQRDPVNQTPFLTYQSGKEKHIVWYEDAGSLRAKVERLRREGITSVGFWMLGAGDPQLWGHLGELKK